MAWWRKEKKQILERGANLLEELIECCNGESNPIKFFSAHQIRKATDNFSVSNLVFELYSDVDNKWYSGKNENHHMLLIKKAKLQGYKRNNCRDIAVSSMVSGHKNFLKLIGCCLEFKEGPVMVYHHGVKKHYRLVPREHPLKRRMKIAEDIATALAYLHTAFPRPFVYRTLSPENIILDEDGLAKLTNFSFCVSIPKGETFVQVDTVVGIFNYMDYNYMMHGVVSEETDVYAIGMFMLKLLTGERFVELLLAKQEEEAKEESDNEGDDDNDDSFDSATISKMHDLERLFPNQLSKIMEKRRMDEIADPNMLEKMGEISKEELCRMKALRKLSLRCMGVRGEVPTIVEVAKELKKIQRSLQNENSSSPSGETQFDFAQDISSLVLLSNQTKNTKALLTSIAWLVFEEMFQWVILRWFRFFRRNRRMC